jgi:hypothetical protein
MIQWKELFQHTLNMASPMKFPEKFTGNADFSG